jgi:hypothetical protein
MADSAGFPLLFLRHLSHESKLPGLVGPLRTTHGAADTAAHVPTAAALVSQCARTDQPGRCRCDIANDVFLAALRVRRALPLRRRGRPQGRSVRGSVWHCWSHRRYQWLWDGVEGGDNSWTKRLDEYFHVV